MMRSMFSGISGLSTHQLKMDVIGNNIANVNTVGFKAGRVTFKEVYSQTIKGASSPQMGRGGTNPHQVGLGVGVASMDTMHMRSPVERTDNPTDLAIDGEGFFIVSDDASFINRSYTRAGDFKLDEAGNLVTGTGSRVLGYMVDSIDQNGKISYKNTLEGLVISRAQTVVAKTTEKGAIEGNLNANQLLSDMSQTPPIDNSFPWEFNVYDGLGGLHKVRLNIHREDANSWRINAEYYRPDGTKEDFAGERELTFEDGKLSANTQPLKFNIGGDQWGLDGGGGGANLPNGAKPFSFDIDISRLTQFVAPESTLENTGFDGYAIGSLTDFEIGPSGEIMGIFSNGQNKVIGKVALANFRNPSGLIKTSNNMYRVSPNSGDPIFGSPGSGGLGQIAPGALEMSNVDLSREFTEMIRTQRGFQANSRIITTSDEMLQELVNLKR